jgi:hypothetical protein
MREAASDDKMVPQPERNVQYDIPTGPGVYELALYFADPLRQPVADRKEDAQNERHFQILINGRVLLEDLDPIADSGYAPVDVRVFKDVRPAPDGKVHLELRSDWGRAFVSALELTPGIPGKLRPSASPPARSIFKIQMEHTGAGIATISTGVPGSSRILRRGRKFRHSTLASGMVTSATRFQFRRVATQ